MNIWNAEDFYPTPESLLDKITAGIDWRKVGTVLEPSAGKGNIAEYCKRKCKRQTYRDDIDVDCIEINDELQKTLRGKELRVVHDDFLTFHTFKHYDLIIMNPPFSQGAKHLLHAIRLQRDGFGLICILNAETLRNPCNNERVILLQELEKRDAKIEYLEGQFLSSENPTGVEIAVVKLLVPAEERESEIFDKLQKKSYQETLGRDMAELAPNDYIVAAVRQYNVEVEAGIRLICEYKAMCPHIMDDLQEKSYSRPILEMKLGDHELSTNAYVKVVRQKYWSALFRNPKFTGQMTSNLAEQYYAKVETLKDYDFSTYNIRMIEIEMRKNLIRGIEECIVELFDKLSYEHSYHDEIKHNIHYFNGWKTNQSWFINKKVILPYMDTFSKYDGHFEPDYTAIRKLGDIERALNYLDGGRTAEAGNLDIRLRRAKEAGQTKDIRLKYFKATFYKKGTCHLEFLDEDLLKKFNIFGSQQKGWLPQGYGKRKYEEMDEEEKAVIDSFEGEESYEKTVADAVYFIYDPSDSLKMIGTSEKMSA